MPNRIDRREFLIASGATAGISALSPAPLAASAEGLKVTGLKIDLIDRPLGLENADPRLSWRLESNTRGVKQAAFRIRVASSEAKLKAGMADIWDSGKVSSGRSIGH